MSFDYLAKIVRMTIVHKPLDALQQQYQRHRSSLNLSRRNIFTFALELTFHNNVKLIYTFLRLSEIERRSNTLDS